MGDPRRIDVDVAIVGAGIAGLWVGNLLAQRGLSLAICESGAIGGTQTAASQGIVHGGLKYALGGKATRAAKALAAMPARWRACLAGEGEVDLRGVPISAEHMVLFAPDATAKVRALFAGRLFRQCRRLDAKAKSPYLRGFLAELDDFVLDVPALIRCLAEPLLPRLIPAPVLPEGLVAGPQGIAAIRTPEVHIEARAFVFAAGSGNEALTKQAGFAGVEMAHRPLRQTSVHLRARPRVFAHCLQGSFGASPDMTITSHGQTLYIGGQVAEDGAERGDTEQAAVVAQLLRRMFLALDLDGARFQTHRLVRAEPAQRSSEPLATRHGNCILCWPLKLAFAPRLGEAVSALLDDVQPGPNAWPGTRTPPNLPWAQPPYTERASC